jgi:hypothetical protein
MSQRLTKILRCLKNAATDKTTNLYVYSDVGLFMALPVIRIILPHRRRVVLTIKLRGSVRKLWPGLWYNVGIFVGCMTHTKEDSERLAY